MEIKGEGLDDVLRQVYRALLDTGVRLGGSRGEILECLGVTVRIGNPRARISRSENRSKPFSALGELLWYMSGSEDLEFIKPYVSAYKEDAVDGVLEGAYGPRLFRMQGSINQFDSIEALLKDKPDSKRAVIQLFKAEDIASPHKEIPCTTTMQFFIRAGKLHMSVTMRSNDAFWGMPHDVFCFTMIQEVIARRLGCELGEYLHYAGSMHFYTKHEENVRAYLNEGVQRMIEMPPMPHGDAFARIGQLTELERQLRSGNGDARPLLG
jgi:thymidylate synthase